MYLQFFGIKMKKTTIQWIDGILGSLALTSSIIAIALGHFSWYHPIIIPVSIFMQWRCVTGKGYPESLK